MLIGVDLKKDTDDPRRRLQRCGRRHRGVQPQPARRINRELDGDLDIDRFEHEAFYNEAEGRVEIYIRSLADQRRRSPASASASPPAS